MAQKLKEAPVGGSTACRSTNESTHLVDDGDLCKTQMSLPYSNNLFALSAFTIDTHWNYRVSFSSEISCLLKLVLENICKFPATCSPVSANLYETIVATALNLVNHSLLFVCLDRYSTYQ